MVSILNNNDELEEQDPVIVERFKRDCGPEGHDTPESMNHYSMEEEGQVEGSSPENGQKEENELTEFKTNLNLDFKSRFTSGIADHDSDSGEEENTLRDNSPILSDKDAADQPGNIRISQHMQTQQAVHQVKSPSNAHQYEAVALESELGNPSNMKSKTSMGFASGSRHKQRPDEAISIDPAPRDPRQLSKNRVD